VKTRVLLIMIIPLVYYIYLAPSSYPIILVLPDPRNQCFANSQNIIHTIDRSTMTPKNNSTQGPINPD